MPTLLQINVTANWGSTGRIAEAISHVARVKGWESYIAYGRRATNSTSSLLKVGTCLDTYLHFAGDRILDMEGRCSVRASKQLVKQIKAIKPNVVHLHNLHDHYLNYQILFEYLNGTDIKVVWTFHDCWAFTGHCYHFAQVDCMKWQSLCGNCIQRHKFADRSSENYILKKSLFTACKNLIIVPCSYWMENFVKKSFLKDKPIRVIHNGVDLETFRVLPNTNKTADQFHIIAVSNVWTRSKGINDLYRLRELLDDNYKITVIGLSATQIKDLPKGIQGVERTQSVNELVELYNEADVLVNPTYADTFPTVNLEALACGTPVITYRTGGSPEAVDDKTGAVIEQGNVNALSDKIREFVAFDFKNIHSEDCRKRAVEYFDKNRCFERYVELYCEILNMK